MNWQDQTIQYYEENSKTFVEGTYLSMKKYDEGMSKNAFMA